MNRLGRRRVLAGAGLTGAGLSAAFLAACGGDDKKEGTTSSGQAQPTSVQSGTTSAAPTTAAQPKRGGTLSISHINRAANRDVHQQSTVIVQGLKEAPAYSRLLKYKAGADIVGDQIPAPDLAERWEQVDAKTYTFKLRSNAKWHDIAPVGGRPVTAEDIAYSFTRQKAQRVNAGYLEDIDTVRAVDPTTLHVELSKPNSDFLVNIAATYNKVIAREVVEKYGDLKEAPVVGSGAFIVDSTSPESTTLKRNPSYWVAGKPYLDSVKYTQIDDRSTTLAALRTGQISFLDLNDKKELELLLPQNPKLQKQELPATTNGGVSVNLNLAPLTDLRVRQALNKAIDRKSVIDTVFFGGANLTTSLTIDSSAELPKAELEKLLAFDPKGAQALLREAGVGDWSPKMTVWNDPRSSTGAELAAPIMASAGIKPQLEIVDSVRALQVFRQGDGLVIHWGFWPTFSSVGQDLTARWKTGGVWNGPKLSDPELDRLIEAQQLEMDKEKRKTLLLDIQRRLFTSVLSWMPVLKPVQFRLLQPQVRDVFWAPYLTYEYLEEVWLDA